MTHSLFRFPAKFHPPIARELLSRFTGPEDVVLDPFCGSGTLLVEASALRMCSLGCDVDPLAVFISKVKTHRFNINHLKNTASDLIDELSELERAPDYYQDRMFMDISPAEKEEEIRTADLWLPKIPNIDHWFRRYVQLELAQINHTILQLDAPRTHKDFFLLVFASIIRNSSNADPVPVSGLEVTSHMRQLDREGRLINTYALFRSSMHRALGSAQEYARQVPAGAVTRIKIGDATRLSKTFAQGRRPNVIITSPPYSAAVDYYRRHKLEMYWLRLTLGRQDRLELLQYYIGRPKVAQSHPFTKQDLQDTQLASRWEQKIRSNSPSRADSLKHYLIGMQHFFREAAKILENGMKLILVAGDSSWRGEPLPTRALLIELATPNFKLKNQFWYPLKNRYMSYARHNGADIRREHILEFERS